MLESISCQSAVYRAFHAAAVLGRDRCLRFRVVSVLLGVLLVFAAALKTHQMATEPIVGGGLFESRWFLAVAVQYELLLGFWLISGHFPRAAWWAALGTFGVFAVVAAAKGIAGEESCGCFGRVSVSPWLTLTIDVSAVVGLCWCDLRRVRRGPALSPRDIVATPEQSHAERWPSGLSRAFACFVAVWLPAAVTLGLLASGKGEREAGRRDDRKNRDPIAIPPLFGEPPFKVHHAALIRNETDSVLRFTRVTSSCGCSRIQLEDMEIAPGERTWLHLEVDLPGNSSGRRIICLLQQEDGAHRRYDFHVSAFPTIQFLDESGSVTVGAVRPGQSLDRRVPVFLHAEGRNTIPPEIVSVVSRDPAVTATFLNSSDSTLLAGEVGTRRMAVLDLHLNWMPREGPFSYPLEVHYRGIGTRIISGVKSLTVSGFFESVYDVTPKRIRVESVRPAEGVVTRPVILRCRDNSALEILSVDTQSKAVTVINQSRLGRGAFQIVVGIIPTQFDDFFFTECVIRTNHAVQPVVILPVSGTKEQK